MKHLLRNLLLLICIHFICLQLAEAHSFNVSNGGDALLCFTSAEKKQAFLNNGDIGDAWALSLDYWVAQSSAEGAKAMLQLKSSSARASSVESLQRAYGLMSALAAATGREDIFGAQPIPADWEGQFLQGQFGLGDLRDEQIYQTLPPLCVLKQAFIRTETDFYMDPTIVALLKKNPASLPQAHQDIDQLGFLFLHELLAKVMAENAPCYRADKIYIFVQKFFLFLNRRQLTSAWFDPSFSWESYFETHHAERVELARLVAEHGLVDDQILRDSIMIGFIEPLYPQGLCPQRPQVSANLFAKMDLRTMWGTINTRIISNDSYVETAADGIHQIHLRKGLKKAAMAKTYRFVTEVAARPGRTVLDIQIFNADYTGMAMVFFDLQELSIPHTNAIGGFTVSDTFIQDLPNGNVRMGFTFKSDASASLLVNINNAETKSELTYRGDPKKMIKIPNIWIYEL